MIGIGPLTLLVGAVLVVTTLWRPVRDFFATLSGSRETTGRHTFPRVRAPGSEPMEGRRSTARAEHGDTVRIHYVGRLSDGSVFDTSRGEEPLEFTLGSAQVIPGLDRVVEGMEVGETRHAVVPPTEAYGPRLDDRMAEVDRARLPPGPLAVGDLIEIVGSPVIARIAAIREGTVLMDVNHPLAGEDLAFEITLLEIVDGRET